MGANVKARPGNPRQRHGPARSGFDHGISQAIRNLPTPLLPQLAWHCVEMERVMGIEPIFDFSRISRLAVLGLASAIQVRDFAVCWAA